MARKKKTITEVADSPVVSSETPLTLVDAVKRMIALYEQGHTVNKVEDYRYPGLKEVVVALKAQEEAKPTEPEVVVPEQN